MCPGSTAVGRLLTCRRPARQCPRSSRCRAAIHRGYRRSFLRRRAAAARARTYTEPGARAAGVTATRELARKHLVDAVEKMPTNQSASRTGTSASSPPISRPCSLIRGGATAKPDLPAAPTGLSHIPVIAAGLLATAADLDRILQAGAVAGQFGTRSCSPTRREQIPFIVPR